MWTKIYRELFWKGFSKEQYEQVKGPIEEENRRSVVAWSIGAGLFWIFSLAMSLKSDAYTKTSLHPYLYEEFLQPYRYLVFLALLSVYL